MPNKLASKSNDDAQRRLLIDPAAVIALSNGTVGDPFAFLGPHRDGGLHRDAGPDRDGNGFIVRAYLPGALKVDVVDARTGALLANLSEVQSPSLFAGFIASADRYRLRIQWPDAVEETEDPYAFGLLISDLDIYLFAEGQHLELGRCLGAQLTQVENVLGVRFAVWAPNARRVSVVGDFNSWDGRRHIMRKRVEAGLWELFVPRLKPGAKYKFEILGPHGLLPLKSDPLALQVEPSPGSASIVTAPAAFEWTDAQWLQTRSEHQAPSAPVSTYEVHAGSWKQFAPGQTPTWDQLAETLIPYVSNLGFTHIELMPITAHPFGGSWGYQPLGLYAPHAIYGEPAAFARFVDRCHAANIGVILDWVPAHFPSDAYGLAHFDGTALYEYADPREGFHQDWNTLIYNFGRNEVRNFLLASAIHWLERYHIDGLRVDAVASMLYRDYSRQPGGWLPNKFGGRENLEAVDFLRQLNARVTERCPGAVIIAEESTAWPGVTADIEQGGLGFAYKWNMGWMHDTLQYIRTDPLYRNFEHNKMTFGLLYAFAEKFVMPLSHDEVVHGKGSLIGKMPGDRWQKFANLRVYFGFMWMQPGKKLLFMGGEFGQEREWNHDASLDWAALDDPLHRGLQQLVRDLNTVYREQNAAHALDSESRGFQWIIGDDSVNSVFAFCRYADNAPPLLIVCNFTPVPRYDYRVGVPRAGFWRELLNSDAACYGGGNIGNGGGVQSSPQAAHQQQQSLLLTIPPLSVSIFIGE
ncbi:MAG: glgB [Verrucomicrobiaceae bacterium]|nr:glgB [Verrucomicrobiaceae bacterium]